MLWIDLENSVRRYSYDYSYNSISTSIRELNNLKKEISELVSEQRKIYIQLKEDLNKEQIPIPNENLDGRTQTDFLIYECSCYDFCISVLNFPHHPRKWEIFNNIVHNCGWIFHFESICLICNRPTFFSLDEQNNLHNDGKPAIEYADGFKVYAHHGVWIPEKYGTIPTSEWKSQWLLEETNAELRRILIQIIGYNKICKELGAIELDSWQEYTLLKIKNYIEINSEPMHLLKMTCPSTEFIHFLRVPPDVISARVAITWVNWGVDPEEFAVQT